MSRAFVNEDAPSLPEPEIGRIRDEAEAEDNLRVAQLARRYLRAATRG